MWYQSGDSTCYATSVDGMNWVRPTLDGIPGTNKTVRTESGQTKAMGAHTVWLDLNERDPQKRFKTIRGMRPTRPTFAVHYSPDGIHWGQALAESGNCGDTTTMFY